MKKFLLSLATFLCMFNSLAFVSAAAPTPSPSDAAKQQVCKGVNSQIAGNDCGSVSAQASLTKVIKAVLTILSYIAGVAAVIMIVLAGLKYITSGGEAGGIASAKNSLIYALVGIVIVFLAQVIVKFVLNKVT